MPLRLAVLRPVVFLLATMPLCAPVLAVEIEANAPITAVTVFPDRAQVTRSLEVEVPAGEHSLLIGDLPTSLFPDSLRVEGEGLPGLQIGSVETRTRFAEEVVRDAERRLRQELDDLRDKQRAQDDAIHVARIELDFITALGREVPRHENEAIQRGQVDPATWQAAWQGLGQGAAEVLGRIRAAEMEKRDLQNKIQKVERELGQIRTDRKASLDALVKVSAPAQGKVRLSLDYQLHGASWRPLYDARLDSENGQLKLVQLGEVRQGTGEDWRDVQLSLSTARPSQGAQPPVIDSWFVDFARPTPAMAQTRQLKTVGQVMTLNEAADSAVPPPPQPEEMVAAAPVTATVEASGFAALYRIPGEATVSADNAPQTFVMVQRDLETKLRVETVPKIRPEAFLMGEIAHEGEDPLLPGPVAVFRDGAFVGRSGLELTRPGETFDLAFGADDRVKVEFRLVKGERSEEGLINKDQRHERRYRIEVTNHHSRDFEVTVLDQVPVARDERIEIKLLRNATKPDAQNYQGRSGVLAWSSTYEPDEMKTIDFGYEITFPQEETVPGF